VRRIVGALVLAMVAAWVYSPCLHGGWLWDDGLEISQNPVLREAGGWWRPWVHPEGMDYFPLKSSLQWIEWSLWGANPLGYHLVNLGLHIASSLLIWSLLRRLGVRTAYLGGLLFAVHPLAVESVAWISEFKNTVSTPLLLLAALAYVDFDTNGRRRAWLTSLAWFFAALACKTSVVMLPVVLLLYAWWRRGRLGRRDILAVLPFFAAALALGAATVWFQSTRSIGIAGIPETLRARLAQAGWSIIAYARLCVWPAGLEPVYPSAMRSLPNALPWIAIAIVLGVLWLRRATWGRHCLLGLGWFLLNLVPVLGIIPMAYLRVSPMADHFAYLPLVGWVGLAAAGLGAALNALEKRSADMRLVRLPFAAVVSGVAAVLAVEAHGYAAAFHDEKALWTYAVEHNPTAWLARNNLGKALYQDGRPAEAIEQFRQAVALEPDSPEAHANLGNCLQAQGLGDDARHEYLAALAINPRFAGAHFDLGLSLLQAGRREEAADQFRTALQIDPSHAAAANSLGLALAGMGRLDEAAQQYRLALRLNPEMPEAHLNLGNAYYRKGRFEEAVSEYREALRIYPGYSGAHGNLGHALAALGRMSEADVEFARARSTANH
jgi:tetratricopeptide (TPR) repeat protein